MSKSVHQRTRLQTAAYLLGARHKVPDLDDSKIHRTRAVQLWHSPEAAEGQPVNQQSLNEKGNSDGLE